MTDTVQTQPNRGFAWRRLICPARTALRRQRPLLTSSASNRAAEAANLKDAQAANFRQRWIGSPGFHAGTRTDLH